MRIRTKQGDTVDSLLWQHLKRNDETITDAFWQLNRKAADHGPIFPIGVELILPQLPQSPTEQRASPWD